MRWPPWSPNPSDEEGDKHGPSNRDQRSLVQWSDFTEPRTVVSTLVLTGASLAAIRFYRTYLRRIPEAASIQTGFFRRRSLFGRVTSVGDGDNFRMFHTPGGRLAGWDWFPGRKVPRKREVLKDRTVCLKTISYPLWLTIDASKRDPRHQMPSLITSRPDPRPSRRRRRARIGAFRATGPTVRGGSARVATGLRAAPTRASLHLQAGPVRPRRVDGVRAALASATRRRSADDPARSGDRLRGQDRRRVRRGRAEVPSGRGMGQEEATRHVERQQGGFRKSEGL